MLELVAGDLLPSLEIELLLDDAAVDLTDADTYTLRWLRPDGTTASIALALNSSDPTLGLLKYDWVEGDTDVVGVHRAQVLVTWIDGPQTFPNDGTYYLWQVYPAITIE